MRSFDANRSRTSAGGPMKVSPWARTMSAKDSSSREEAVAGVDGVAAADDGRGYQRRGREVASPGFGRADADGPVGEVDGERIAIGLAVGDDGLDAEGSAGADDPEGDLTAVGDKDAGEHSATLRCRGRGSMRPGLGRGGVDVEERLPVFHGLSLLREVPRDHAVLGRRHVARYTQAVHVPDDLARAHGAAGTAAVANDQEADRRRDGNVDGGRFDEPRMRGRCGPWPRSARQGACRDRQMRGRDGRPSRDPAAAVPAPALPARAPTALARWTPDVANSWARGTPWS